MDPNLPAVDFRDFWYLAPAIVLSAWGLVVLLADLAVARRMTPEKRRTAIGWLALGGVVLASPERHRAHASAATFAR